MLHLIKKVTIVSLFVCSFFFATYGVVSAVSMSDARCTVNGRSVPCDQVVQTIKDTITPALIIFVCVMIAISILGTIFWIMMLIHAATHKSENQVVWILVIVFTQLLGAIIYYFVVKRKESPSALSPSK